MARARAGSDTPAKDTPARDTPGRKEIPWEEYVKDARELLVSLGNAGPALMGVWTEAWCEWATSAVKTHEQLALRWTAIIRDPGRGATELDRMREDCKAYYVDAGAIPERAVLRFLQRMSEITGPPRAEAPSAHAEFLRGAGKVVDTLTEAANQIETAVEAASRQPASRAATGRGAVAAAAADPLAGLHEKLSELRKSLESLTKLRP